VAFIAKIIGSMLGSGIFYCFQKYHQLGQSK